MSNPLLTRLAIVFERPDTPDPVAWMTEVSRLIKDYKPSELDAAFDIICKSHRGRIYPSVSEIVTGCADARGAAIPVRPPQTREDPRWTPEAFAMADRIIDCDMGRQAARDGWVLGLHEFIRTNRRLPHQYEIHDIIDTSAYVDRCASGHVDMGACHGPLKKLANNILNRREKLAQRVLGEAAE